MGIARRIQEVTDFSATPSGACSFCDWRPQCAEAAYVDAGHYDWLDPDDRDDPEIEGTD